ncbi:MAG: Transcription elongation factor GreA [Candidatus Uhrbacteria bacterium GW2011_GWF2_39_13]|uniref:Transcription elongation factor GreA n=1 Tax=Candidatus Uhrbacteria bacterium GW2011_GWF2_39_13 TaxID=1618995 RepID=A0A0G0QSN3_9BACT|nr:MAG: Transcription elongation factor GreA [Candidatus Uhrbacteria bacterium GW2011_GWF2_39_13]HAU66590.1 transcription elongation factor GreA [Candidatus Uhrbacteria bacterium]
MATYLSAEAFEQMKIELEHRKKIIRREISEKILHAKEMGDLSENFEYQTAKEEQSLNETRIMEIESILYDVVLVKNSQGASRIALGTTFIVETEGKKKTYSLVGSNEANPLEGKISNESPIGIAFLDKKKGDKVEFEAPSGVIKYTILDIF